MPRLFLAVLFSLLFLPAIPAEAQSAFTIEYTTKTYYRTGKVRDVRHSILAVHSDGSWAVLEVRRRGDADSYVRKHVWDATTKRTVIVDAEYQRATVFYPPSHPRVAGGYFVYLPSMRIPEHYDVTLCAAAKPLPDPILEFKVAYLEPPIHRIVGGFAWPATEEPVAHGVWMAPELGCAVVRSETIKGHPEYQTLEVKRALRIQRGDPDRRLFEIPKDFKTEIVHMPLR